jgi:hypothetical protein
MAAANLLGADGKILSALLPTPATTTPTLAEVLASGDDGDGADINNVNVIRLTNSVVNTLGPLLLEGTANVPMGYSNPTVVVGGSSHLQVNGTELEMYDANINMNAGTSGPGEIVFDTNIGITASNTTPDTLELIAVGGATVVVSDKTNTGQVYDTYFNKPGQIHTLFSSTTTNNIPNGVSSAYSFTPTRTGLYALQFGYETGTGATGIPVGCILTMYDTALPSTSVITIQSYMNTGTVANTVSGLSIKSDTVELTEGITYDFRFAVQDGPIVISTANDGEVFFNVVQYC